MSDVTLLAVSLSDVVQHLVDAASLGSLYALLALGIALIFGIMNLINFAYGELIMIGAFSLVLLDGWPWPLLIVATILIVVVAALIMERVAFRPLRGADATTLLVASFVVSTFLQSLAEVLFGTAPRGVDLLPALSKPVSLFDIRVARLDLVTIAVAVALLLALRAFLAHTSMGIRMRAAAEDFEIARVLGVDANRVIALAFAISGVLAAVAAVILVTQTSSTSPTVGVTAVLVAFIATILGGVGSLPGAVLGGFLLGALTVGLDIVLPLDLRSYRDAFVFAVVFAVLVLRPQGLIVPRAMKARV